MSSLADCWQAAWQSVGALPEAVIEGIGITFEPNHLARNALNDGQLKRVLEEWCPAYPGLCIYYSANRHVPSGLRALIDTLTATRHKIIRS
ncbi:LysR substrate-binding domain-containing protein [Serratia plymuthica]|uniref:LysR substrate-binding domain-containing protein n=1 Tax=Serratia plymuthica TaxID=82996 RepID=UPI000906EF30